WSTRDAADGLIDLTRRTTSADGQAVTTEWTTPGNPLASGRHVERTSLADDGSATDTVSDFGADGRLAATTTRIVSRDGSRSSSLRDLDGDGVNEHDIEPATAPSGATTITASELSADGRPRWVRTEIVDANALTRSTSWDDDGNGVTDFSAAAMTVLNT